MQKSRPLVGVLLVGVTVLLFAGADSLTKYLSERYPVPLVVAVRYLSSLALLLVFVFPRMGRRLWRAERAWLLVLRGCVLSAASVTMAFALRLMPVGETIAIMYLSPFAVMLLAIPLLKERVTPLGWVMAMVGFSGVLLILRPGGGLDPVGILFALTNACCTTAFHLLTRTLSRTETTIAMLFYVTLVGAVIFTVAALPSFAGPMPTPLDLGAMALLGTLATLGHFLFAAAYREAPASLIAPVNYLHVVWAAILGWIFFDHLPDRIGLLGMGLIVFAGVAIAVRTHLASRSEARLARPPQRVPLAPE